jgi:predicted RNA-binding protein with PUA-like domain
VGIAKIIKPSYSDPTSPDDWTAVDIAPVKGLSRPITLGELKMVPKLKEMKLLKIGRLSVSPVTKQEFDTIVKLSS